MTKEQLRKFIKDTRGLIRGAPAEKKMKLLKLIKEAKRQCDEAEMKELELDHQQVEETLDSKYATAALAGALSAAGAVHNSQEKSQQSADYLDEV